MGLLDWLGLNKQIAPTINAVSNLYTTDKARIEAEADLQKAIAPIAEGQQAVNLALAQKESFFESAWQPSIGWTCGACVALYYVPQLLVANYIWAIECFSSGKVMQFPIDPSDILNLVYLLFGFGTYHIAKTKLTR